MKKINPDSQSTQERASATTDSFAGSIQGHESSHTNHPDHELQAAKHHGHDHDEHFHHDHNENVHHQHEKHTHHEHDENVHHEHHTETILNHHSHQNHGHRN